MSALPDLVRIIAVRESDEHVRRMSIARLACSEAGVPAPEEVERFFGRSQHRAHTNDPVVLSCEYLVECGALVAIADGYELKPEALPEWFRFRVVIDRFWEEAETE